MTHILRFFGAETFVCDEDGGRFMSLVTIDGSIALLIVVFSTDAFTPTTNHCLSSNDI
jgi:hypothetical protein